MRKITAMAISAIAVLAASRTSIGAPPTAGSSKARQLLNDCASMAGSTGSFGRLKSNCQSSCAFYIKRYEAEGRHPSANLLDRCEADHTAASAYLNGTLYSEGRHYTKLIPPQPTRTPPGAREVTLITSLACGGCMTERATFAAWGASAWAKQRNVVPVLQPLAWGYSKDQGFDYDAYALVDIVSDELPADLAAKVRKLATESRSSAPLRSPADAQGLLVKAGVTPVEAEKWMGSFTVQVKLRRAQEAVHRYRPQSPQTYVLDGRFVVPARGADGKPVDSGVLYIEVIEFLLQREAGEIGAGRRSR